MRVREGGTFRLSNSGCVETRLGGARDVYATRLRSRCHRNRRFGHPSRCGFGLGILTASPIRNRDNAHGARDGFSALGRGVHTLAEDCDDLIADLDAALSQRH